MLNANTHKECSNVKKKYLMFSWLQWVIVTDEEEAHGGYQELKQFHQRGIAPIWPHLHPSQQVNSAACGVA